MDCGPACLKMITCYYGKFVELEHLRKMCYISKEGVSLASLMHAAENLGFKCKALKCNYDYLQTKATLPCIAWWQQEHYIVIYKIRKKKYILQILHMVKYHISQKNFCQDGGCFIMTIKGLEFV